MTLSELKISPEHFAEMASHTNAGGYLKNALAALTDEDIVEIYKDCL